MKNYAMEQSTGSLSQMLEMLESGNSTNLGLQMSIDRLDKRMEHEVRNIRLETKSQVSTLENDLHNYFRRQEERLAEVERKMLNVDEREVVQAHVAETTGTIEKGLVAKIEKIKKKLSDRIRTIEKEHLSVPGIIGKGDNSEHETLYEYAKYHFDK